MALEGQLAEALAFNAPYVIDRLIKNQVTDDSALAERLFTEAKKYLVLCAATPDVSFGMWSAMVDEAWHAFVLFTTEYAEFGQRYFGQYVHHAPVSDHGGSEGAAEGSRPQNAASFNAFRQRYEELYGHPLPDVWYDGNNVASSSRVINERAGSLTVLVDDGTVHLVDDSEGIVLSVNDVALEAIDFIARMDGFYVRELPGDVTTEEKIGVIQPLVRLGVLRLAP